jgi:hypothetical protein
MREQMVEHRANPACASCHKLMYPLGFALEHYDSLGRWRTTYRNDEPIDDSLSVGDGPLVSGPEGLRRYLAGHQDQFYRTLCAKLLAYSLGRGELASDRQLVHTMLADLQSGDGNLADLIVDIVKSKQFGHRRGPILEPAATAAASKFPEGAQDGDR